VDRAIAAGGMGLVYSAKHVELDQDVALKFMRAELRGQISTSRFTSEARATAKLRSAHVARVYDVGVLGDGTPFMVMELLEGIDLECLLEERGRISPEIAAELVAQACDAVAEAHSAGIIHRDLKPANLFLTKTPQGAPFVKVVDFGISKATIDAPSRATAAGTIMGSPPYMSPETLKSSRNADARSDIWALGVILYELATGRLPFDGEGVGDIALKVHHDEPVWPALFDPNIPKDYDAIVRSCMQKDPSMRCASVVELRDALTAFLSTRSSTGMTLSLRTSQPRIVIVDEPESPPTPRTAERIQKARAATTVMPSTAPEAPRVRSRDPRVLAGAIGAGAALVVAIAIVALGRSAVPPVAASTGVAVNPEPPVVHLPVVHPPVVLPAVPVDPAPVDPAPPQAVTPPVTSPRPSAVRPLAKVAATAAPVKEPPSAASLTPAPPPVQPSAAPSSGRALRDRGF
jgi:serine/threonine-protein kinase